MDFLETGTRESHHHPQQVLGGLHSGLGCRNRSPVGCFLCGFVPRLPPRQPKPATSSGMQSVQRLFTPATCGALEASITPPTSRRIIKRLLCFKAVLVSCAAVAMIMNHSVLFPVCKGISASFLCRCTLTVAFQARWQQRMAENLS